MANTDLFRTLVDIHLLDRYLAGLATPAEEQAVLAWLTEHPDHGQVLEAFRTAPLELTLPKVQTDSRAWLAQLEARMNAEAEGKADIPSLSRDHTGDIADVQPSLNTRVHLTGERRSSLHLRSWTSFSHASVRTLTGVLAIAGVFGVLALGTDFLTSSGKSAAYHADRPSAVYTTRSGERASLTLPDGSDVVLSAGSRLHVPTNFGDEGRTLYLEGEALFTVIHASGIPFTVVAGGTPTRVLGTSFAVRNYATDSVIRVSVRDGKVAVANTVVAARQQLAISRNGTTRLFPATAAAFSFASGVLTLPDMPLSDAIVELNRWYGADIRIGDPGLASQRIEGEFTAGSLSDLVSMLQWTFSMQVVREGRVFTLYRRQS